MIPRTPVNSSDTPIPIEPITPSHGVCSPPLVAPPMGSLPHGLHALLSRGIRQPEERSVPPHCETQHIAISLLAVSMRRFLPHCDGLQYRNLIALGFQFAELARVVANLWSSIKPTMIHATKCVQARQMITDLGASLLPYQVSENSDDGAKERSPARR